MLLSRWWLVVFFGFFGHFPIASNAHRHRGWNFCGAGARVQDHALRASANASSG